MNKEEFLLLKLENLKFNYNRKVNEKYHFDTVILTLFIFILTFCFTIISFYINPNYIGSKFLLAILMIILLVSSILVFLLKGVVNYSQDNKLKGIRKRMNNLFLEILQHKN